MQEAEYLDSARTGIFQFTYRPEWTENGPASPYKVDEYNLHSLLMNNSEWVTGSKESFLSKKPICKSFYVTKPNLLEVNVKDFFLAVNPVLSFSIE